MHILKCIQNISIHCMPVFRGHATYMVWEHKNTWDSSLTSAEPSQRPSFWLRIVLLSVIKPTKRFIDLPTLRGNALGSQNKKANLTVLSSFPLLFCKLQTDSLTQLGLQREMAQQWECEVKCNTNYLKISSSYHMHLTMTKTEPEGFLVSDANKCLLHMQV